MNGAKKPAVFLDRDGVILELVDYLHRTEDLRLTSGIGEALSALNCADIPVIVITNQSAVARGILSEDELHELHKFMEAQLAEVGARLDAIYYCPHHPDEGHSPYRRACNCRKPAPGMILRAAEEMNINLACSTFIGDTLTDMTAAWKAGVGNRVLVLTGHGRVEYAAAQAANTLPTSIAPDAPAAVKTFLETGGNT
jgi:D-glycero-D-manno-heptose 1,7-bisphosphate phosphatase